MKRLTDVVILAVIATLVTSCDEDPKARTLLPTAPAPVALSPVELLHKAPSDKPGSSVCASHLRSRKTLLTQISTLPDDSALTKRAGALAALITDACN